LTQERVEQLLSRGPATLTEEDLTGLLLDPFALESLAELIEAEPSDYWLEQMDELGAEQMKADGMSMHLDLDRVDGLLEKPSAERSGRKALLQLMGLGALEARGGDCWALTFNDDEAKQLQRKMAERMYGNAETAFELLLLKQEAAGRPGQLEFVVEVSPAPTASELTLAVTFPAGEKRVFLLKVPASPRKKSRSLPCEPIAAQTFRAPRPRRVG
jgi:hypothetical protein